MAETTEYKKLQRSAAYPSITLEEALDATRTLRESYSSTPFSRDSAAIALGYKGVSGASSSKIAACVHFGLLVRDGNVYKQSELADQILVATSDEERMEGIVTAFRTPTLYRKLVDENNGRALPKMLDNILVRQYGITERAAKQAANDFIKSATYAGVLQNGILNLAATNQADMDSSAGEDATTPQPQRTVAPQGAALVAKLPGTLPVTLPGTEVTILFPEKYAFALSTGAFIAGIKQLEEDVKAAEVASANEQPADASEE